VLSALSASDRADPLLIPGVYRWMSQLRARFAQGAESREVLIQADRDLEYAHLKRVMYSCSKAGFSDFTILAIQKE
jgi:biopolymer transport protein ExbD